MPKKATIERAHRAEREGKSASSQAGEFVREEIEAIRKGEHGARSTKQAIAIGLSKARRAGVKLPVPKKGSVPDETREKAKRELAGGGRGRNAQTLADPFAGHLESAQARGAGSRIKRGPFDAIPHGGPETHFRSEIRIGEKSRAHSEEASEIGPFSIRTTFSRSLP